MKILFIADPIEQLNLKGDTSLVLLQEAYRRGHEIYWTVSSAVHYADGDVIVRASRVESAPQDQLPTVSHWKTAKLREWDAVFIRKDPPFDSSYIKLCWMLCFEESRVWMMNRPSLLLRYHEKLVPYEAYAQGYLKHDDLVPTFVGAIDFADKYFSEHDVAQVVTKPFLGYGGRGVERFNRSCCTQEWSWNPAMKGKDDFIQPFEEAVLSRGDRRVFFLNGDVIGDFVRLPAEGGFISNLAQGGRAILSPMESEEKEVLIRLGNFLKSIGIVFAGADLIGTHLSEVNITSPTGLKHLLYLEGNDRSTQVMEFIEKEVKRFQSKRR